MDDFTIIDDRLISYHGSDEYVVVPENITYIQWQAFSDCKNLKGILLPESIRRIDDYAFEGCTHLEKIDVAIYNKFYVSHEGVLYDKFMRKLLRFPTGRTAFSIPEDVTEIGKSAFYGCTALTSITIPKGITKIGKDAFRNCSSLTSITLPEGVVSIDDWAFADCKNLESINLPESVTEIGENAFYGCHSLNGITLPEGITEIKYDTFRECRSLTNITIPEHVASIGLCAFYNCSELISIRIPESVCFIADDAFEGCRNLTMQYREYSFPPDIAIHVNDKILHMLKEKDFSVSLRSHLKARTVFRMYLTTPEDSRILDYLKTNIIEMLSAMIDIHAFDTTYFQEHTWEAAGLPFWRDQKQKNIEIIRQIIESGEFIHKENIDLLIRHAIEQKAYEIQIMLTNYKAKHIGFDRHDKFNL